MSEGKKEILLGDCLELMKDIPNGSIDMILCDLPYGTTACKWDVIIPFDKLWEQYERIIKPNGAIVLTASQPFTSVLVTSNLKMFRYEWIWEKNRGSNFATVKYQPMKEHTETGLHPTQKPTALFEYLVKTYTNENELVLDNCAGSGTTAIACLNTNRQFIVMEKEQKYYDIILKRVGDFNKKFEPQTLFGNEM
jgi:DNA modification methylase